MNTPQTLEREFAAAGLLLTRGQLAALTVYVDELLHWGRHINLTGTRDRPAFIRQHIVESAVAGTHLELDRRRRWADVGTGAGLPGVVLAALYPDTHWLLVEPSEKRWAFLINAIHRMGLVNAQALRARAGENAVGPGTLDGVISRALGPPALSAHVWLKPAGLLAVFSGPDTGKWADAPVRYPLAPLPPVPLPGAGRWLLCFTLRSREPSVPAPPASW